MAVYHPLIFFMAKRLCFLVLWALFFLSTGAQSQDIKPLLSRLTPQQKLQLLEYIRSAGTDLDQEILWAFAQLNAPAQQKVQQYLQLMQPRLDGKADRTQVRWSRDTIQFGAVREGIVVLDSVTVTNTGSRPYQITGVKTACDCTVLHWPQIPVMPGETAVLRIEFNSVGKKGKVRTGIVVEDNSSPNTRSIIHFRGTVTGDENAKKHPWEE